MMFRHQSKYTSQFLSNSEKVVFNHSDFEMNTFAEKKQRVVLNQEQHVLPLLHEFLSTSFSSPKSQLNSI